MQMADLDDLLTTVEEEDAEKTLAQQKKRTKKKPQSQPRRRRRKKKPGEYDFEFVMFVYMEGTSFYRGWMNIRSIHRERMEERGYTFLPCSEGNFVRSIWWFGDDHHTDAYMTPDW